jgi:SAM-dependent methyltransferase
LFRVIQPYAFQQRQFQDALIDALRSSVRTLADEVRTLSGQVRTLQTESAASRAQADARLADLRTQLADVDAQMQALSAADEATNASLAALSGRLFVAPFHPGRERFLQRTPNGEVHLGYGNENGVHQPRLVSGGTLSERLERPDGPDRPEPLFRVRQRLYLPLLKHRARVLDIGCGRGAMLDLLRVARVPAMGVDFDPAMVSHCRANGHLVEEADALQFLRIQPDASIGAIFSARLLEHLSFEQLQEFLRLCRRRLEQGGVMIAETTNPREIVPIDAGTTLGGAVPAGPISPELALALCQHAGFEQAHVVFPTGTGALDPDRLAQPRYAVLATAGDL